MTTNLKMTFQVTPGARIRKADAPIIGNILERLKTTGPLTAERVLDEATNKRSPLHKYFTWNDQKAAHKWRLEEARRLIRSVEVVIEDLRGKQIPMRAYFNVRDGEGVRSYEPMEFVFETPDLADQVIQQALAQLESWKLKFAKYQWAKGAMPGVRSALKAIKKVTKTRKK